MPKRRLLRRRRMPLRSNPLPPVRLRQINRRPDRDNAGRINFGVRHVIMTFDVIEINRLGDAGLLIQVHQISLQVPIIDDPADIAFEVTVIDDVEPNECAKEPPIGFDNVIVEQVAALG